MGNSAKAAEYAKKVTDHTASFKLAGRNSFESVRRFPATGELIFGLYANSFLDDFANRFLKNVAGTYLDEWMQIRCRMHLMVVHSGDQNEHKCP